jgi:hypothetical protein
MPDGDIRKLRPRVQALQRNTAALLALLGGDDDDQLRFWEILKGITTPADFILVEQHLSVMQALVDQVQASAKGLETAAKNIQGTISA